MSVPEFGLLIDGLEVEASTGETFSSLDPANGEPIGRLATAGAADVDRAVTAARLAYEEPWRQVAPAGRGRLLQGVAPPWRRIRRST